MDAGGDEAGDVRDVCGEDGAARTRRDRTERREVEMRGYAVVPAQSTFGLCSFDELRPHPCRCGGLHGAAVGHALEVLAGDRGRLWPWVHVTAAGRPSPITTSPG